MIIEHHVGKITATFVRRASGSQTKADVGTILGQTSCSRNNRGIQWLHFTVTLLAPNYSPHESHVPQSSERDNYLPLRLEVYT